MSIKDENYYHKTAHASSYPALTDIHHADVCVVGAGMAGLTAALNLVREGKQVALVEAEQVAWGASGRNGGFVGPGWSAGHAHIAKHAGEESARELQKLSIEGMQIVADNISRLDIDNAQPVHGLLSVTRQADAQAAQAKMRWLHEEFGYEVEFFSRQDLRELLDTPHYFHALFDQQAFHFHPVNYALGLAQAFVGMGGQLFEHSAATQINGSKGAFQVTAGTGRIDCEQVLISCGGYTDKLVPKLAASYVPISTYVALTKPDKATVSQAIKCNYAIGDTRRASDYYRVIENGERILWGGMITTRQREPHDLAALLKQRMLDTYPQLDALEIDMAWSGRMAYARHLMPQIGELSPGLWYCTGFGGHGMNTTAIGGTVVAEGMLGMSERYQLFAPFGLVWNGHVFGKAAVQLTYWYYRLHDWWQERRSLARTAS